MLHHHPQSPGTVSVHLRPEGRQRKGEDGIRGSVLIWMGWTERAHEGFVDANWIPPPPGPLHPAAGAVQKLFQINKYFSPFEVIYEGKIFELSLKARGVIEGVRFSVIPLRDGRPQCGRMRLPLPGEIIRTFKAKSFIMVWNFWPSCIIYPFEQIFIITCPAPPLCWLAEWMRGNWMGGWWLKWEI